MAQSVFKVFSGIILLALLGGAAFRKDGFRVMSFNLRYDNPADGQDAWMERRQELGLFLRAERLFSNQKQADILGFQEALSSQLFYLDSVLSEYSRYSRGRDDGDMAGEHCAIYWRKSKFALLDSGTFWLSEQPHVPAKSWDAALPRIASWVKFRERSSGKVLVVLNTHFDHIGVKAREASARQIAAWAKARKEPVVVMGDLNSEPEDLPIQTLLAEGLTDARPLNNTKPSFNGFTWPEERHKLIDFILTKGLIASEYQVNRSKRSNQRELSDHYPVEAMLRWME